MVKSLIYFFFVHLTLFVPSYAFIRSTRWLDKHEEVLICSAYALSLVLYSAVSMLGYVLNTNNSITHFFGWIYILIGSIIFIQKKYYLEVSKLKALFFVFISLSLVSFLFINLNFTTNKSYVPDPEYIANSNYEALNVKVLNITHTNANDNYIPYRQAQFIINRLNPATSSFIDEWGVHFFQRTPLMGSVSAFYFDLFLSKPPVDYLWRITAVDPSNTYLQFQIIASILNSLLLLPAYYLIRKLFNKKTAFISLLFLATSQFFLYNSFYTWPKSLVAFFILFSWYLLLENKLKFTVMAGVVSAAAYLTHDLAFLYIAASLLMLLYKKRFNDILVVLGITITAALPWIITSSLVYKKASTFYLYPFSVDDIPQPGKQQEVIRKFISTPVTQLIAIRLRSFMYLLTPYSLYAPGSEILSKRIWAAGIFPITGAVGLGMVIPTLLGLIYRIRQYPIWILLITPLLLIAIIFGWSYPGSIAAIHFAQPIVVILIGCGSWYLLQLKTRLLLPAAFFTSLVYTIYFMAYSYDFAVNGWLTTPKSVISLMGIAAIFIIISIIIIRHINPNEDIDLSKI